MTRLRPLRRPRVALPLALALLAIVAFVGLTAGGGSRGNATSAPHDQVLDASSVPKQRPNEEPGKFDVKSRPKVVQLEGAGVQPTVSPGDDAVSPGAPTDDEVRQEVKRANKELASFRSHLSNASLTTGPRARVKKDGTAVAPADAPDVVKRVILAGNEIAKFPYKWGGGHGAWKDNGYDCSGSVSFALAAAGLVKSPMTSGAFMRWGKEGQGDWITVYANGGHMFMFVAGLRFDTSGQGRDGTRWQDGTRTTSGFAERYYPGL